MLSIYIKHVRVVIFLTLKIRFIFHSSKCKFSFFKSWCYTTIFNCLRAM